MKPVFLKYETLISTHAGRKKRNLSKYHNSQTCTNTSIQFSQPCCVFSKSPSWKRACWEAFSSQPGWQWQQINNTLSLLNKTLMSSFFFRQTFIHHLHTVSFFLLRFTVIALGSNPNNWRLVVFIELFTFPFLDLSLKTKCVEHLSHLSQEFHQIPAPPQATKPTNKKNKKQPTNNGKSTYPLR